MLRANKYDNNPAVLFPSPLKNNYEEMLDKMYQDKKPISNATHDQRNDKRAHKGQRYTSVKSSSTSKEYMFLSGEKELGRGAYGVVKCVMEVQTDTDRKPIYYAVKKNYIANNDSRLQILKEAEIHQHLKAVHSEKLLLMIDVMDTVNSKEECIVYQIFPLMSFDGNHVLNSGFYNENFLIYLSQLLVNTFSELHDHYFYHCDLKPDNILFHVDGYARIADFGSAVLFIDDTILSSRASVLAENLAPEFYFLCANKSKPSDLEKAYQLLDAWHIGLTLLKFSLMQHPSSLNAKHDAELFFKSIRDYLKMSCGNKTDKKKLSYLYAFIKAQSQVFTTHLDEILKHVDPVIAEVIKGFLTINWEQRLTPHEAHKKLASLSYDEHALKGYLEKMKTPIHQAELVLDDSSRHAKRPRMGSA